MIYRNYATRCVHLITFHVYISHHFRFCLSNSFAIRRQRDHWNRNRNRAWIECESVANRLACLSKPVPWRSRPCLWGVGGSTLVLLLRFAHWKVGGKEHGELIGDEPAINGLPLTGRVRKPFRNDCRRRLAARGRQTMEIAQVLSVPQCDCLFRRRSFLPLSFLQFITAVYWLVLLILLPYWHCCVCWLKWARLWLWMVAGRRRGSDFSVCPLIYGDCRQTQTRIDCMAWPLCMLLFHWEKSKSKW